LFENFDPKQRGILAVALGE